MNTKKLTLSAPEDVIEEAKQIAAKNNTSVSAMFTRLLNAVSRSDDRGTIPIGPVTQRASGIVDLPSGTYDELLTDALEERYDRGR
jgi:hypothetical protein